jgi:hypothetical protein
MAAWAGMTELKLLLGEAQLLEQLPRGRAELCGEGTRFVRGFPDGVMPRSFMGS